MAAGVALTQAACSTTSTSFGDDGGSGTTDEGGSTGSTDCDATPPGKDAGDVANFPSGSWTLSGTTRDPFVVAQDSNGVFAYSAICTHEGCEIGKPDSTGKTTCPCHGAQFDGNGTVVRGPARTPLVHYAVAVCGGHVYVDTATTVDASTRTPVS